MDKRKFEDIGCFGLIALVIVLIGLPWILHHVSEYQIKLIRAKAEYLTGGK